MTHKIIFDTDPGIDDALALAYALRCKEIELLGITTIFGNVHTQMATANALRVLEVAKCQGIPVAHGCSRPLIQPLRPPPDFVHGSDGLGNINLPAAKDQAINMTAVEFLLESSRKYAGELTIVAVGPLTNIAHAVLLDSEFAKRLKSLVIMGGAAIYGGNVSLVAEANMRSDPHAADIVFQEHFNAFGMVGLDVTEKVIMSNTNFALLRDNAGELGKFIWDCSRFYVDFYSQFRPIDGCFAHDASALVYLVRPELFTTKKAKIRVTTEGNGAGNTMCDFGDHGHADTIWNDAGEVDVCLDVQDAEVMQEYMSAFINK